jgi:uncharacterized phage-associated protein
MCRAADIAIAMVNGSIEKARTTGDSRYYMDYVKLHKLMYLGQCYMLGRYGRKLFRDTITAHYCGPYIEGIPFIQGSRGFGLIKVPYDEEEFLAPTIFGQATIEWVLKEHGTKSTEELIDFTKDTFAYIEAVGSLTDDHKPTISIENMLESLVVRSAV